MEVHICKMCGKGFTGRKKKYCSEECSDEVRRIKNKERMRKVNPPKPDVVKECEWCGQPYAVPARNAHIARFCSDECRDRDKGHMPWEEYQEERDKQKEERLKKLEEERKAKIKTKECAECGQPFETIQPNQLTCSTECSLQRKNRLKWQRKEERYNDTNIIDKDISVKVLYKRDKGICYICGGKCDFNDNYEVNGYFTAGPNYPSIDHLIPIARGGMHAWDNVKLAHHHCNSVKSDSLPEDIKNLIPEDAYILARKVSPRSKQVNQYTSNGKTLIATYKSTGEAERMTGVKAKAIQKVARGEQRSTGGYWWSYV